MSPLQRKAPRKPRTSKLRRSRIKPKKRSKTEAERIYGGSGRIAWVQSQRCLVCGYHRSENAHTENGGMSRKADASSIVPLCTHCHFALHTMGRASFEELYHVNLAAAAIQTERAWRAFQERTGA